jgi:hypothetical protein
MVIALPRTTVMAMRRIPALASLFALSSSLVPLVPLVPLVLLVPMPAAAAPLVPLGPASASPSAPAPALAPARRVWVEARPWTCDHQIVALARDTELACDALGGRCQIAASEEEATHRAVLVCDSAVRWTLRIETSEGQPVVAVRLVGDREERLRKAAMWIARTEDDGPTAGPPSGSVAPPAPAPPAPVLRVPSAPAASPARDPSTVWADEPDFPPPPKPKKRRAGGLALDATFGVTNSSFVDSFRGLHASIVFPAGPFHVGPVGAYDQASSFAAGYAGIGHLGGRAGWGAPFSDRIVGLWLESGVAWGTRPNAGDGYHLWGTSFGSDNAPTDFVTPYGRAEVMLQLPLNGPLRPYVAVAGTHAVNEFGEGVQSALFAAGLAWRAW